jgi:hypothetical protein
MHNQQKQYSRYTLQLPYHDGPWPLEAESVNANALSGLPPVPGFDGSCSASSASTNKKKTSTTDRHPNAYTLSIQRGIAPAPRRSLHPAVIKGMQPTATDSGRPMGTLALRKLMPHFWPPFSEEAPNMAGLDRGKLAKEVIGCVKWDGGGYGCCEKRSSSRERQRGRGMKPSN